MRLLGDYFLDGIKRAHHEVYDESQDKSRSCLFFSLITNIGDLHKSKLEECAATIQAAHKPKRLRSIPGDRNPSLR